MQDSLPGGGEPFPGGSQTLWASKKVSVYYGPIDFPLPQAWPVAHWLFCWTEVGARYVGIVQSLLASCRLQGIDPYVYFVDVLQRIDTHPAFEVHLLTPRLWKQHFAANPLRSDLDRVRQ
jgi:hypothetical protein